MTCTICYLAMLAAAIRPDDLASMHQADQRQHAEHLVPLARPFRREGVYLIALWNILDIAFCFLTSTEVYLLVWHLG